MLALNLEPELEKHLAALAERNGYSVDAFIREAIERMMEDLEDKGLLDAALKDYDPGKNISMAEMRRELDLEP